MKCIWCDEEIVGDQDRFGKLGFMHPECTIAYSDTSADDLDGIMIGSQPRPLEEE